MPVEKPKMRADSGVDGNLYKMFLGDISWRTGQPTTNTAADKVHRRGTSSSIHHMYLSSSMSSKGQCATISSADMAAANV